MMQRTITRRRSTQRSFAVSTGLHALLLVGVVVFAGRGAVEKLSAQDELTQIAYIEANYGEDVAAKVRMKTRKKPSNAAPGPGIETRSAVKPKAPAPQAAFSETPRVVADVSAPRLEREDPTFAQLEREKLNSRTSMAVSSPDLTPESVKRDPALAQAGGTPKLSSRVTGSPALPKSGSALVSRGRASLDEGGPDVPARSNSAGAGTQGTFDPSAPALRSKSGGTGSGSFKPSGGSLSGRSNGTVDLDVGGKSPTPGGGSSGSTGKRTVLDYGSGGGGLSGRGGTLKGSPMAPAPGSQKTQDIAEAKPVKVNGKGSNMTISGQIAGRKILHSVPPEYSKSARKNGWEGVVAVHFTVLADGRVKDNVYFEQTSAHRDLNKAAMAAIKQFKFAPLSPDDAAVEQWGVITIVFRLN